MTNASTFLLRNPLAFQSLEVSEPALETYAQHHAGGTWVLWGALGDGRAVKMHDAWDEDDEVVVHTYWLDGERSAEEEAENGDDDRVERFGTGAEALACFLERVEGRKRLTVALSAEVVAFVRGCVEIGLEGLSDEVPAYDVAEVESLIWTLRNLER